MAVQPVIHDDPPDLEEAEAERKPRGLHSYSKDIQDYLNVFKGYGLLDKHSFPLVHQAYREAVEGLYALRQAGHRDPDHCPTCRDAIAQYRATERTIEAFDRCSKKGQKSSDARALLLEEREVAYQQVLDLLRKGHRRPAHCSACAEYQQTIQQKIAELMYGSRLLVLSIAKKRASWIGFRIPVVDLVQEGLLGLPKAIAYYNRHHHAGIALPIILLRDEIDEEVWLPGGIKRLVKYSSRFSSYAGWWIKHAILRYIADRSRTIRLPVHLIDVVDLIARVHGEWVRSHFGTEPTNQELMQAVQACGERTAHKVTEDHILFFVLGSHIDTFSLDKPVGEDGDITVGDFYSNPTELTPEQSVSFGRLLVMVERLLQRVRIASQMLKPHQARIVLNRLGLDQEGRALTLKELGDEIGYSRERIRQIQVLSLRRLSSLVGIHPDEFGRIMALHEELAHAVGRQPGMTVAGRCKFREEEDANKKRKKKKNVLILPSAYQSQNLADIEAHLVGLLDRPFTMELARAELAGK